MSKQLLFYDKILPLSVSRHKDWAVKVGSDYRFARGTNSVPLTAAEFRPAAAEYGIVFAGDDDTVMPVVLLGAQPDENRFVDEHGHWGARYIPAFVRRYPFVFSLSEDGKTFILCIDEGFDGCNTEGRGEMMFDADGERTEFLNRVMGFQTEYQTQFQRTQAFGKRLHDLGLLEPIQAQIRVADGRNLVVTGIRAVSRDKVKALDPAIIAELVASDQLELIYLHLHSLIHLRDIAQEGESPAEREAAVDEEKHFDSKQDTKGETEPTSH